MGSLTPFRIPILDLTKENLPKLNSTSATWLSTCNQVRNSLEEYGFFIVEDDKINLELQKSIFGELEELFNLPLETKVQNKYAKPLHGYVGQIPVIPLHEGLGIDNATSLEGIQSFTNLMWPRGNDHFCETVHSFTKIILELDHLVTKMIFESYGVSKYYDSHIEPMNYLLRVMKYREPRINENKLAFSPHTDKSFTTLIYQNSINALEIELRNGEWIDVELSPISLVLIAGDAIMAWSNGRIQSPNHRVTMNNGSVTRYSLGFFSFSNGTIQVPEELADDDEHPLQYKSFQHLDYLRFYHSQFGPNTPTPSKSLRSYCGV